MEFWPFLSYFMYPFNAIALRMAKTLWSFGHSECNRAPIEFWEFCVIGLKRQERRKKSICVSEI